MPLLNRPLDVRSHRVSIANRRGLTTGRVLRYRVERKSALGRGGERVADVDLVVGDDAKSHSALLSRETFVAAAIWAMARLDKLIRPSQPGRHS
jgi:hypothetical protein